jgi:hypothetical protein
LTFIKSTRGSREVRVSGHRIAVAALATLLFSVANAMGPESPIKAYYWFSYWVSVGNLDAAAAQFAEGAIVVAGPSCPPENPCVGRAAIRARYVAWVVRHAAARPVIDQRLDRETLYAHDARSYRTRFTNVDDWREGGYTIEFREGRIESLVFGGRNEEAATAYRALARRTSALSQ